jgi:hypothetical protein
MSDATTVHRRVLLLNVPTDLQVHSMRHLDDLLHELHIMQAGVETGQVEPGPRLAALMSQILEAYTPARGAVWEQTEAALAQGLEVVDIEVELPPEAASAVPALAELLDEADQMCRTLELLTLAAPPEVAELRRWVGEQIVAQVARSEQPAPFRP